MPLAHVPRGCASLPPMETASLVISIIAAVFAGGAVWYARGQKAAADRSARASEQSAQAAAVQSADAAHETVGFDPLPAQDARERAVHLRGGGRGGGV